MKLAFILCLISAPAWSTVELEFCEEVVIQHNHPKGVHIKSGNHNAEIINSFKYSFTLKATKIEEPILIELDSGGYVDEITLHHNCDKVEKKALINLN